MEFQKSNRLWHLNSLIRETISRPCEYDIQQDKTRFWGVRCSIHIMGMEDLAMYISCAFLTSGHVQKGMYDQCFHTRPGPAGWTGWTGMKNGPEWPSNPVWVKFRISPLTPGLNPDQPLTRLTHFRLH